MNVYARILDLCKIKGDTMYSLSKGSGVSESVLSRLKNNSQARVSKKNLILLANYFCVNVDWLETGEGNKDDCGVVADTLIRDNALWERFVEISQYLFGDNDYDEFGKPTSIRFHEMTTFTNIPLARLKSIIYEKNFPTYTEIISLLKSNRNLNANWLLFGVDDMLKQDTAEKEMQKMASLVDTISTLQFTLNTKNEIIEMLNNRIQALEQEVLRLTKK